MTARTFYHFDGPDRRLLNRLPSLVSGPGANIAIPVGTDTEFPTGQETINNLVSGHVVDFFAVADELISAFAPLIAVAPVAVA